MLLLVPSIKTAIHFVSSLSTRHLHLNLIHFAASRAILLFSKGNKKKKLNPFLLFGFNVLKSNVTAFVFHFTLAWATT